jgi:NADPH:quinone reductase-like Zn-dependent oxidoreductase
MTAWQVPQKAPQGLALVQRPRPAARHGEIIVRLKAASLNYRDLMVLRGHYDAEHERGPVIPVADGVGEVVETGEGVTRFRVGDRVTGNYFPDWIEGGIAPEKVARSWGSGTLDGVLADYFTLNEAAAVAVPAHLTDAEAATLSCAGVTAWNALFVSHTLTPGETVLLLGTGGVSLFALQFAKLAGARVILTSSDDAKLARARQLGADDTINYKTKPAWAKEVLALTGGKGVDLVVDTVAGAGLNQAVESARIGGTVAVIGVLGGLEAPVSTVQLLVRETRVNGIFVGSRAMFDAMNRAVALHRLRPVVDRVFPFSDAPAAYAHLESGKHFGKVVIAR